MKYVLPVWGMMLKVYCRISCWIKELQYICYFPLIGMLGFLMWLPSTGNLNWDFYFFLGGVKGGRWGQLEDSNPLSLNSRISFIILDLCHIMMEAVVIYCWQFGSI